MKTLLKMNKEIKNIEYLKNIEQQSLEIIKKNNIVFIEDLCSFLPFSRQTFYNYKLNKSEKIIETLLQNKIKLKKNLRERWYNSDNPTLQISLYKLLSTENEYLRLANSRQDVNVAAQINIKIVEDSEDLIDEKKEEINEEINLELED